MTKRISAVLTVALLAGVGFAAPMSPSAAATPAMPSDFNGDGVQDLAIGIPGDEHQENDAVGAVQIIYGAQPGTTAPPNQYLSRNTPGMGAIRQYDSSLGATLASADFNRDGYADLAASIPGYDIRTSPAWTVNVGGVIIVYGSAAGLAPSGTPKAKLWTQNSPGVHGVAEDDDSWGETLAAADFDADGYPDLAIGAPQEQLAEFHFAGMVSILRGSSAGLTSTGEQLWSQNSPGIQGTSERSDEFGRALAAGDFDGDGADDLAVGATESLPGARLAGAVNVLYGAAGRGLTARDRFVSQSSPGVPGAPETNDRFGHALCVADFNRDGYDDLVIAAPQEDIGAWRDEGLLTVIYGTAAGLSSSNIRTLQLATLSAPEPSRDNPYGSLFGWSVAAADVDADSYPDLAVGSPGERRVDVISGGASGLDRFKVSTLVDTDPVSELAFGRTLWLGQLDGVGGRDLAVGTRNATIAAEDGTPLAWAGAVRIFYDGVGGFSSADSKTLHQGVPEIATDPHEGESFGWTFPGAGTL